VVCELSNEKLSQAMRSKHAILTIFIETSPLRAFLSVSWRAC
jgi:hypothetical protein